MKSTSSVTLPGAQDTIQTVFIIILPSFKMSKN